MLCPKCSSGMLGLVMVLLSGMMPEIGFGKVLGTSSFFLREVTLGEVVRPVDAARDELVLSVRIANLFLPVRFGLSFFFGPFSILETLKQRILLTRLNNRSERFVCLVNHLRLFDN